MIARLVLRIGLPSIVLGIALSAAAPPAAAQSRGVEVGGHVSVLRLSELETTGTGDGVDVLWPVTRGVAIDGALTWFPGADDSTAGLFERQQHTLGLAGVRIGLVRRRVELFAGARAGFLRFGTEGPVVCIAIFPTPLSCQLAGGYTAVAADLRGGISAGLARAGQLQLRVEAGDLLVRYGFQAFRPRGGVTDGFISHNVLVSAGLGWRF